MPKRPLRSAHLLPFREQTDSDRYAVAERQRLHTNRDERCECGRRPDVNKAEQHLDDSDEDQRPDGNSQAFVDLGPQLCAWNGIITSESPRASRGSDSDGDGAEDSDDQD